ncbi:MAG TPA: hypothetical protein VEQ37_06400 [Actinomycetota bacterium]|nr:hypothetical protein [Actinomycetota bacterium]
MASADALLLRPAPGGDPRATSRFRAAGLGAALFGVTVATAALVANIVAGAWSDQAGRAAQVARIDAWSFGLNTAAFGVLKLSVAIVLLGILRQLWLRVESVKAALPSLAGVGGGPVPIQADTEDTPWGAATLSSTAPKPMLVHRLARVMWGPSLAMGFMAVMGGLVLAVVQATKVVSDPALAGHLSAWVKGIQFLGEGFLLAGVSFVLGSILSSLRAGGGEVQESAGVVVKTLRMPATAKAFLGLMMLGLMVEVFQFVVYVATTSFSTATAAAYATWLGPVREAGLGLILSGIVLALVTIGNVLGFQFSRITEIVRTGR